MTGDAAESSIDIDALAGPVRAVEALMLEHLRGQAIPASLGEAVEYALLGGGKRLRPMMVLWSCVAVGGRVDGIEVQSAAAAVEMIHAFSLVHDDLPAMDDDDLRRGRPTLHRRYGEPMAILAGDAMMPLAIELILRRVSSTPLACRLIDELCAATRDMISGQVYDTLPGADAEGVTEVERLRSIHRHKTGALLRASCRMGAVCGRAAEAPLACVTRFAEATGLMFQVVDDLLDVTGTTQELGKTAGKDARLGKLTYPGLIGVEASRAEVARLHGEALEALEPLGKAADPLRRIGAFLAVRRR